MGPCCNGVIVAAGAVGGYGDDGGHGDDGGDADSIAEMKRKKKEKGIFVHCSRLACEMAGNEKRPHKWRKLMSSDKQNINMFAAEVCGNDDCNAGNAGNASNDDDDASSPPMINVPSNPQRDLSRPILTLPQTFGAFVL